MICFHSFSRDLKILSFYSFKALSQFMGEVKSCFKVTEVWSGNTGSDFLTLILGCLSLHQRGSLFSGFSFLTILVGTCWIFLWSREGFVLLCSLDVFWIALLKLYRIQQLKTGVKMGKVAIDLAGDYILGFVIIHQKGSTLDCLKFSCEIQRWLVILVL